MGLILTAANGMDKVGFTLCTFTSQDDSIMYNPKLTNCLYQFSNKQESIGNLEFF